MAAGTEKRLRRSDGAWALRGRKLQQPRFVFGCPERLGSAAAEVADTNNK
jgi:hypothetical protein